jgi:hypothetical protein
MTGSDEPSEGFLQRWSRRKIDAEPAKPAESQPDGTTARAPIEPAATSGVATPATTPAKPDFDLSSLPSLESITASTDIRAFLTPGVPADLARAALRRAWTADATIRDFIGLSENSWDFNDPAAMPGFGPLEPGYDIKRAVAQLFGKAEKVANDISTAEQTAEPARLTEKGVLSEPSAPTLVANADIEFDPPTKPDEAPQTPGEDFVQCDNITASHKSDSEIGEAEYQSRRNHGGALPQ